MKWDESRLRFIESASNEFAAAGFPTIAARVVMTLTATDEGRLTAEDLMEVLGVSRAAVSQAIRYLDVLGWVRTANLPGTRKHIYTLAEGAWFTSTLRGPSRYRHLAEVMADGLAGVPEGPGRDRMAEMAEFFAFLDRRMPELFDEWVEHRRNRAQV